MREKMTDAKKREAVIQVVYAVGGSFLFAFGVNVLITPLGLYNGGFMGIAQLIRTFIVQVIHVPVPAGVDLSGIIYFIMNIPLFYMGYRVLGKGFAVKTLVTVGIQSVFLTIVPRRLPHLLHHRRHRGGYRYRPDPQGAQLRRRTGHHRPVLHKEIPRL